MGRCHDDHFYDNDARDQDHWHNGPYDRDWRGDWQGGNPGDQGHGQGGNPGGEGHGH